MKPHAISYALLDRVETGYRALHGDPSSRYVRGEGAPGHAMVINYAPGAAEVLTRSPIAGPIGRILTELMDMAGLWATNSRCDESKPANCWVTNVLKFRPTGSKKRDDAIDRMWDVRPLLRDEWIAVGMPRLIIPIGSLPMYAITGELNNLSMPAGRPLPFTSQKGLPMTVWPMINPVYGVHDPALQQLIEEDWERLGEWRNGR